MKAIGIDLGTTNSVAAVTEHGRGRALPNREGQTLTPSVVTYLKLKRGSGEGQIVVGRNAINNAARDPANTIFSVKRLMGRQYGEQRVEEVQKRYGFQLSPPPPADSADHGVKLLLNGKPYTPVEISSEILKQVKADAELALGEPVTHAVITVPAYFEERQRHATAQAGELAGLTVLSIIDEPTAAALAFGLGKEEEQHRVLVYDLGGGTFDISLIQMYNRNYDVLEIQGDNWLGGDDFDQIILNRMIESVKAEQGEEPCKRPAFLLRAKTEAEAAKKALSVQQEVEIQWSVNDPNVGMIDVDIAVTRQEFERDIRDRLERTIALVHKALKNQSLTPEDITAVLLVGGSTAIPLVHTLLAEVFGEGKLRRDVNPMECVALGAAIYSDRCEVPDSPAPRQSAIGSIGHITAMHLGINAVQDDDPDHFEPIILKGTPYPLDEPKKKMFRPTAANQKLLRIPVYEGDSPRCTLNAPQGEIEIPLPHGLDLSDDIEISFDYDKNRVLTLRVSVAGAEVGVRKLVRNTHITPTKPVGKDGADGAGTSTIKNDWREQAGPTIRMGKHFLQGYRMYMSEDDRKDLEAAIAQADQSLKADKEAECSKALLVIENKTYMGSGPATLMFIAESVMQQCNPQQAKVLGRAIAALQQAIAQGSTPQIERLMDGLSMVIANILNTKGPGPETQVQKSFNNLVRHIK